MRGRFNITLSEAINDSLDQYANEHDMTRSAVIEAALKEFLKHTEHTQKIHHMDYGLEVGELTQRMKIMEDQIAQLIQPMNNTRPRQLPDEPISIQSIVEDNGINSVSMLNPDEWYKQMQIVEIILPSIKLGTRKSKVSKAVSSGDLKTNGMKGKDCLIKGSSAIEWLKLQNYPIIN